MAEESTPRRSDASRIVVKDDDTTSDGTRNTNRTLPVAQASSTPWHNVHTDMTDNASTASQPPMSSGRVDGAMRSTGHGGMQEVIDLLENEMRLLLPLLPTEMSEVTGTSLFKTMGGSSNISMPGTSSAPVQQQNARTSDGIRNTKWTLPVGLASSTSSHNVHTDITDNASTASQPPMSSGRVDGAMPSTGHEGMQVVIDLLENQMRSLLPLLPTEVTGSLFKMMGGSSNISVPGTSSAPVQQQNARFLGRSNDVPLNTAHSTIATASGHVEQLQSGSTDFSIPMDYVSASHAQSSARQESIMQGPGSCGNTRISGPTSNFQRSMEYHQTDHPFSVYDMNDNGSIGVQRPTNIGSGWEALPSTSRASIVKPSATLKSDSRVNAGALNFQRQAAKGLARMSQYGAAGFQPPASGGSDSNAALEPTVRRLQIGEEPVTLTNSTRNRGGACNVLPVREHGTAAFCVPTYTAMAGSAGLQVAASSSGACHSVPSGSLAGIEETMRGYDVSAATGSTEREQRKDHDEKPSGERPYTCEICRKSFTRSDNLVRHRRIHTGQKRYRCDICAQVFTQQYNLARHSRSHSGEKPYKCATCAKAFTRSHSLRDHEQTHAGETPFKCEICGHSFMNHYLLKIHRLMHTDEDIRKPPPQ